MTGRIPKLAAAMLAATAVLAIAAGTASATLTTIYNNIPSPFPGNLQSQSFEASATSEYGGQVEFEAGTWKNPTVIVTMSTWACFEGTWNGGNCVTPAGAKFELPVTFSVYAVGPGNSVGAKLAGGSRIFKMPYRPSASAKCTGPNAGKWYHMGTCFNGKAFKIALGLKVAKLPAKAIISVAYNTSDWGTEPQRPEACNSKPEGCPYDSLNVAETNTSPSVGNAPLPGEAYISSLYQSEYCGSGVSAGTFGLTPCTEGAQARGTFQPAIQVKASAG